MKKLTVLFMLMLVLFISACGKTEKDNSSTSGAEKSEFITYESENGPVEVPADPQRVVVLRAYAGNVLQLGVKIVGVDEWSSKNPTFQEELKDVEQVSDETLEKIIELEPDLIIGLTDINNIDKLQEIAPTVVYTWGKLDYLTQHLEIGKLLNKEEEARAWVEDFKKRAETLGEQVQAKIGEDATVSVIESSDKELYVFSDNRARGTEILYQAMNLKMPEKVKEIAVESGNYTISAEVLPEYAGDYIFLSKYSDSDTSFQETETYKNIPAVKNSRVFEMNGQVVTFSDPITLDQQLMFIKESFLGN